MLKNWVQIICFAAGVNLLKRFVLLNIIIVLVITAWPFVSGASEYCPVPGYSDNVTVEAAEAWLFDFINRMRMEPETALQEIGVNGTITVQDGTRMVCSCYGCFLMGNEMFPLARSAFLDEKAAAWAETMASTGSVFYVSPDGLSLTDFIRQSGYPASNSSQIVAGIMINDYKDPLTALSVLMQRMLVSPDGKAVPQVSMFTDPRFDAVGLAFRPAVLTLPDGTGVGAYLLVIVLEHPLSAFQGRVVQCGHVYQDTDQNGVKNQGEGISCMAILDGQDGTVVARTYSRGRFCIERPVAAGEWAWHFSPGFQVDETVPFQPVSVVDGALKQDIAVKWVLNNQQ